MYAIHVQSNTFKVIYWNSLLYILTNIFGSFQGLEKKKKTVESSHLLKRMHIFFLERWQLKSLSSISEQEIKGLIAWRISSRAEISARLQKQILWKPNCRLHGEGFSPGRNSARAEKGTRACALAVFSHLSKLSHGNLREKYANRCLHKPLLRVSLIEGKLFELTHSCFVRGSVFYPRTGGSVGWTSAYHARGREFDSRRTISGS